jgi:hypothetical protein
MNLNALSLSVNLTQATNTVATITKELVRIHKQYWRQKIVQLSLPHKLLHDYRIRGNAVFFQLS